MPAYSVDIFAVGFFALEWAVYAETLEHTAYGRDSLSARMNGYREVGLGANSAYEVVPVKVSGLTNVATVRLGGYSSYAIRSDGTLWIWGFALTSGRGILGRNLATATRVDLP